MIKTLYATLLVALLTLISVQINAQTDYTLTDDDVVVTDGILQSCSYDFASNTEGTNLTIPGNLDGQDIVDFNTTIFREQNITGLDLSTCTALTNIGSFCFSTNSISSLDLSGCTSLTSIGAYTFYRNKIVTVDFTNCSSLISVGSYSFYINDITTINFTNCTALTSIGDYVFVSNDINTVDFTNCTALNSIGVQSFAGSEIESLDFSDCTALTSIGRIAFSSNNIDDLNLSNCAALTSIGINAFYGNNIDDIDLSDCTALTSIGEGAFIENPLTEFVLPTPENLEGTIVWEDIDNIIYAVGSAVTKLSSSFIVVSMYDIIYDANTGTGTMANQAAGVNRNISLTTNTFTRDGYVFNGWNTVADGSGDTYADAATFTMTKGDITLYAQWAVPYDVVFDANGGAGSMANQTIAFNNSASLTLNTFTPIEGYTFAGWNTIADGTGVAYADEASFTMDVEGITLYAQWDAIVYNIVFDANEGTGTMANQAIAFNNSASLSLNTFTRTDYIFAGWNTIADGTGVAYADEASFTMNTDGITLYAQWDATVSVNNLSDQELNIYPNPATTQLTIVGKQNQNVAIYSLNGAKVMEFILLQDKQNIDISHLKPGIYLVSLYKQNIKLVIK